MAFLGPPRKDTGGAANAGTTTGGISISPGVRPASTPPGGLSRFVSYLTAGKLRLELLAVREDIWLNESPVSMVEGESRTYTVTYEGAGAVSSPSVVAYQDGTLVTGTLFPTNTPTASGTTVTLSALTGVKGGETYIVAITATVDGQTQVRKLKVNVAGAGDE